MGGRRRAGSEGGGNDGRLYGKGNSTITFSLEAKGGVGEGWLVGVAGEGE